MVGLEFFSDGVKMMLIINGQYTGWLAHQRRDGAWVVTRMANKEDYESANEWTSSQRSLHSEE